MDEASLNSYAQALKEQTIKTFNIDPEKHDRYARFAKLQNDKARIEACLKTQIEGSGKVDDVHRLLIAKHNEHVYDILREQVNISGPLGDFCTCADHETRCLDDVLIAPVTEQESTVQEEGLLGLENEVELEVKEAQVNHMADLQEFAKLGS
jgi:hypothetical protein